MDELVARLNLEAPETTEGRFMYMPAGEHVITPSDRSDKAVKVKVLVNRDTANTLNSQLAELNAKHGTSKAYFDLNHEDGAASFWPKSFEFADAPKPGVYVTGEFSATGKRAIEGKDFRSFSPVFWVDDVKGDPARIAASPAARLNMGGFVNAPAFKKSEPLFAKNHPEPTPTETDMKKTIEELKAKVTELEAELPALKADAAKAAELSAKLRDVEFAKKEVAFAEREHNFNSALADSTIKIAVEQGKIRPQAKELQAKYKAEIMKDPVNGVSLVEALEVLPSPDGKFKTTAGGELRAKEGPARVAKALGELSAKNAAIPFSTRTSSLKMENARELSRMYSKELSGKDLAGILIELSAADNIDANLGTLTGTLVAARTLELFKYEFKLLKMIWTDFSELPAAYNQTIQTRIVNFPAVQQFDPTINGNTGLPNGWSFVTKPTTTDVPITMNLIPGVPIRFSLDILSETARRLFDEQAPAAAAALTQYWVEKIYTLLTLANYNGYAAVNGVLVPTAYASLPVGLGDFARSALVKAATIFNPNKVPKQNRFVLLNSPYYGQLSNDPSITQFYAALREPGIIEEGVLPMMAGFKPIEAPDLNAANATPYLTGFFGHRASIAIAMRMPVDINQILPAGQFGSVTTMTDDELGMPWQLVQYVNQTSSFAEWRLQNIGGFSVGDKRGGLCLTSQ